jgi:SAM-dependent methyltransferase
MNFIALKKLIADTRLPLAITVKQGTVGDLPQETSFDTILYYDVLEHIENDEEELHLACKHLNPGGCIIVVAPAHQSLYSAFDKAIGHYRRYDKNLLRFVVPDSLKETRCIYLDSLGYFAYKAFSVFSGKENVSLNKVLFWDRCLVPLSRIFDPLIGYSIGKSVLGIWKKNLQ